MRTADPNPFLPDPNIYGPIFTIQILKKKLNSVATLKKPRFHAQKVVELLYVRASF